MLRSRIGPNATAWQLLGSGRAGTAARSIGTLAVAALVGLALIVSGSRSDMIATLVVIGFEPDRARLLTALMVDTLVVGAGVLTFAASRTAILAGIAAFA